MFQKEATYFNAYECFTQIHPFPNHNYLYSRLFEKRTVMNTSHRSAAYSLVATGG